MSDDAPSMGRGIHGAGLSSLVIENPRLDPPSPASARDMLISPTMWSKSEAPALGDFEQLVLLGVLRLELDDAAYGAAIRREIHARSGRDVSINAVYTTLERLESKGFLRSWVGDPTPERGGRRRKFYALRPAGVAALRQAYRAFTAMADGLQARLVAK
jgi:PadR family transcriptional regulator, regulatory protein PadR